MSLKDLWDRLLDKSPNKEAQSTSITINSSSTPTKEYDNAFRTNRTIGRQLYHNTNKNYLLAAQLVKPIVNNNVNFIGTPTLFGNKKALKVIDDVNINYRTVHKSMEIEGDIFVWPQWNEKKQKIVLEYIPLDAVQDISIDPVTKEVLGYHFQEDINYVALDGTAQNMRITFVITADLVKFKTEGTKNETRVIRNPFGRIPIVHFSNDRDVHELYGHAEIENIEPQLKFYHELTYEAGAAQSRDGHPKLKISTKDPKKWVDNNFGEGTYDSISAGRGKLTVNDRDLFINQGDDDVNYLYLNKTSGDFTQLAVVTFNNIVEGSETPESNFGASLGTSLASVKEQRPVWIKKIEAKQYERTQPWLDVYDIIIEIHNFVKLKNVKNDIAIEWNVPDFVSNKEKAEILEAFSKAVEKLKKAGAVTDEEIYDTMVKFGIVDMFKTFKQHKEVIEDEKVDQNDENGDDSTEKDLDTGADEETDDNEGDAA